MTSSSDRPLRPMRLVFGPHAVTQMQVRGFSTQDVKVILYTGEVAVSTFQPKKGPHRHGRAIEIRSKLAAVLFTCYPDYYYIVTVEWVWPERVEKMLPHRFKK
jgi:hypothetical protein